MQAQFLGRNVILLWQRSLPTMNHPIHLRPTTPEDLTFVLTAENAPENAPFIRQWSRDRHLQACQSPDERHWIVAERRTDERAGYVIIQGIQDSDQSLLLKRIVITRKGQGYGRSTLEIVVRKVFEDFGAHRLWLDVVEDNMRARSLYQRSGFVEEGRLRDGMKSTDGYVSLRLMSILRPEFLAIYGDNPLNR